MGSIVGYFYESRCILGVRKTSQNTRDEKKYSSILHTKPFNKRFISQLEEYKIELSINVYSCLLMTRMRDRLT